MNPEVVELLQRTKAAILANPDHFNMDFWFQSPDDGPTFHMENGTVVVDRALGLVPQVPLVKLLESCGTTACAAGWIVACAGEKVRPGEEIEAAAVRLIGAERSRDELGIIPLFYSGHWPEDLTDRYEEAGSDVERAVVAAEAIDRWIAADGKVSRFCY